MTKIEQAANLFAVIETETNTAAARKSAATELLALKRTSKCSWDKLGLTADESLKVAAVATLEEAKTGSSRELRGKALAFIASARATDANVSRAKVIEGLMAEFSITKPNAAYYYDRVAPK